MFTPRMLGAPIAEMAFGARSLSELEQQLFEYLRPLIGFDAACSVWSGDDGAVRNASALGYEAAVLRDDFPRFMAELSPAELRGFAAPAPALDLDVVSRERREQLAVYRELLRPSHVSQFVTNVWRSPLGVFGYHFARVGGARRFRDRELAHLYQIAPSMKLAQALLASQALAELRTRDDTQVAGWADDWGLSLREREAANLLARGFQNREIAMLLGISPHTIRNRLAKVFRKADVSTRAELVFAIASWQPDARKPELRRALPHVWSARLDFDR